MAPPPSVTRVAVAGDTFALLDAGNTSQPLVLCLHGFPDHPPSFAPLLSGLAAAGARAVAPWMRGYAPSVVRGPYDVDRLADDVLALADALSPGAKVALVGHDWGAVVTYQVLARAPERVASAVALSVPHPLAFLRSLVTNPAQIRRSWYMFFFQLGPLADAIVARDDFALIERLWRDWSPGHTPPRGDLSALKDTLRASFPAPVAYYRAMAWPPRASVRRILEALGHERRIRVPTLYLHGLDDGCIGPEVARGQERYFAGPLTQEWVAGAGHFLVNEKPSWVTERITRWLLDTGFLTRAAAGPLVQEPGAC